jgi:hypothetical protein
MFPTVGHNGVQCIKSRYRGDPLVEGLIQTGARAAQRLCHGREGESETASGRIRLDE